MTWLHRRSLLSLGLAWAAGARGQVTGGDGLIRLIVPYSAGGSLDTIGRSVAEGMSRALGVPMIVDNRTGASGTIGAAAAARAAPDGRTLLLGGSSTHAVLPAVSPKLPYDAVVDFTPISMIAEVENALVVSPKLPVNNMSELVAYCKARPGQLAFGSSGAGGITHLAGELFKITAGVDAIHVPYKSNSEVDLALLSGQLQFAFATLATAIPHIRAGRMHALALASAQRSPFLPALPTTSEAGFPSIIAVSWAALYGPSKMEHTDVARLNAAAQVSLKRPELKERFNAIVTRALRSTPEELADYQKRDHARWRRVVQTAGIKLEG
ncbi:Bug family tripartite tricarboxylate transporter substrate binding protein [Variovorax sp. Root473]|uniref:Bug family tripartite tricarboxylate transporter substrate binding protein n=1 Tax=Variovorax sp. Root473 TaxID=1736541 RepID=UPI0006F64F18|nr:tripartite tricarboxylate transporter substrate-binding protein [Variovorax sp. Root473]KQX94841.1 hypothetical protein ASD34_22270 [Variovorax sp. Root473]